MKWYEYSIAIVAISLVILPILLHKRNLKKGKSICGYGCTSCKKDCPFKKE